MRLFHVTPRFRKRFIQDHGLLVRFSRRTGGTIHLVSRSGVAWAVEQVRLAHKVNDIAVLYVDIGKRKYSRQGVHTYVITWDIAPAKVLGELDWEG